MFPEYARIYKEQSLNTSRKALPKALVCEYISAEEVLGPESTC
jgi:hypothetical protein